MPSFVLRQPDDIGKLSARLSLQTKFPLTVTVEQGAPRRKAQNRLAQRWFTDIARQLGDQTHEDVRATCKRQFGVPILNAESPAFAQKWDRVFGSLTWEEQVEAIKAFDLPVTRLMLKDQMSAFMDEMQRYWRGLGIHLTDPDALKYEEEFA